MKHTAEHLFGVKTPVFAIDRRWNKMFLNPLEAKVTAEASKDEIEQFSTDTSSFGAKVASAIKNLHMAGQLNPELLREFSNPNLDALVNAGLGEQFVQYRVRRINCTHFRIGKCYQNFPITFGCSRSRSYYQCIYWPINTSLARL